MDTQTFIWLLLGFIFICTYGIQSLAEKFRIPVLILYILFGIFLGSSGLHILSTKVYQQCTGIFQFVLATSCFIIGNKAFTAIKSAPKLIFAIAFCEVIISCTFVCIFMIYGTKLPFTTALLFGALACATAPLGILCLTRQYNANGMMTNTLLGVVAIENIIAILICTGVFMSYSPILKISTHINIFLGIEHALIKVALSCLFGACTGLFLGIILKYIHQIGYITFIVIGLILILTSICQYYHTPILVAMLMMGIVCASISDESSKPQEINESLEPFLDLLIPLFFVLTGSLFNCNLMNKTFSIGLIYLLVRGMGKYIGAYLGAGMVKAEKTIQHKIGLCLMPQMGVIFGFMPLVAGFIAPKSSQATYLLISNVIIWTTIITEIVASVLIKTTLEKSNEINS